MTADQYGVAQHIEEQDRVCKFCGAEDSLMHRHWYCPCTQDSRDKLQKSSRELLAKYPMCTVERGWATLPPTLVAYRQKLQAIPDTRSIFCGCTTSESVWHFHGWIGVGTETTTFTISWVGMVHCNKTMVSTFRRWCRWRRSRNLANGAESRDNGCDQCYEVCGSNRPSMPDLVR